MSLIAIIPARRGSKGVPGKNLRSIAGKPLFLWSLETAKECGIFDEIIVTTDCPKIQSISVANGAHCPSLRPDYLSSDNALCIDAIEHATRTFSTFTPTIVVILQPTSPLRTSNEILQCINLLKESKVDAVATVRRVESASLKTLIVDEGLLQPIKSIKTTNRQQMPCCCRDTGSVYAFFWRSHQPEQAELICGLRVKSVMPFYTDGESGRDIDSLDDWKEVEFCLIRNHHERIFSIAGRSIGEEYPPLVIAEIGINHEGNVKKAIQMVDDAVNAGAEVIKFQCHICEDEMTHAARSVIPGNASESIWNIMKRCELTADDVIMLKKYVESKGAIYMSSPFSRAAADFLESIGVEAYKIGSGECNNYPLIEHIAQFKKPVILSTGMNSIDTVLPAVEIFRNNGVPFALLHCTSLYPTPYEQVRLGCVHELQRAFPDSVVGLSDHSLGNWTCFASISLGARIIEKHFTSDKNWDGPDIPISIDPFELKELVIGCYNIWLARGGNKDRLPQEQVTCDFAFASVVTIRDVKEGEEFTKANLWVKRPGVGGILAKDYSQILGRKACRNLLADELVAWSDVSDI